MALGPYYIFAFFCIYVSTSLLLCPCASSILFARAKIVKLLATDSEIHFVGGWQNPAPFDFKDVDAPGGGPNSSVCSMGDVARWTNSGDALLSFEFQGVSIQLILSSRPDHSPYSVSLDGQASNGDTYSVSPHCGASFTRSNLAQQMHTLTATALPVQDRVYFEVLGIIYDDGGDLPPPPAPSTSRSTILATSSPPTSVSDTSEGGTATSHSSLSLGPQTDTPGASHSSAPRNTTAEPPQATPSLPNTVSVTVSPAGGATLIPTSSPPVSHDVVVGIAIAAPLAVLLLILLFLLWRRRLLRQRSAVGRRLISYPLIPLALSAPPSRINEKVPPVGSAEGLSGDESSAISPTETSHEVVGRGFTSMRLAPEDIDRIAARVHDVLSSRIENGGELPPY